MTQSLPDWLNPDKYPPANTPPAEGELPPFSDAPTSNQAAKASSSFGRNLFSATKEVLETIVPAIIIALLINLFLAQATRVYGQSMEPNLHTDQRLVVEKISYRFHSPQRGDVVVLKIRENAEELLIKRVIALPGETIEIKDGHVFIDGHKLEEPYLAQPTRGRYGPTTVAPEYIFVLGDNRGASNDSRSFGAVPMENLIGHAWLSYWPVEDVGLVD
ncbi:MAG TPA: signal peptidase I [Chloroflexi bacterium]|nr:signal peptidase I [Chloroflexota bacterium]